MSNGKDEIVASYRSIIKIIKIDVFICYSRKDYVDEHNNVIPSNEVSKIKEALTKAGITYWFDEEEINIGDKFTEKIVNSIETSKVFLFLSTKNSCESTLTSKEIAWADGFGKYIIPVRIDKTPYNKQVELRIADLSYVDYEKNPEKGRQEIVNSIKAYLEKKIEFTVGDVEFCMIKVEGGNMGTFYIGETQVTQALWKAVMGNNPSFFMGQENPVECVSWNDICGKDGTGTDPNCFLYKLNQETGKNFRLPKESEWEYAAKGGNKSKNYTYAGSNDIDKVAWYVGNSKNSTHSVKQLSPNELGIYDMSGNVWEWCEDKYEPSSSDRVLRGGYWGNFARFCRVSSRNFDAPDYQNFIIGFRLVLPQ